MDVLAQRFETDQPHLEAVAYRMLGSRAEADDAVQEAWLRLARNGADGVDNLRGWLTTVVARVCRDMLRSRTSRREEPLPPDERIDAAPDPEGRRCWRFRWGGAAHRARHARARRAARVRPARPVRRAVVWTHRGEPRMVFAFTVVDGRVSGIELIADAERIGGMSIAPR